MTGDTDIFEASRARLFSLAYRILGVRADAEDVVQDTFVKWHLHQRAVAATGHNALDTPAAWLATVAKRSAIDRLRRLKHEASLPGDIDKLDGFGSFDHALSAETLAERVSDLSYGMRLVLDRLSAQEQVAFLLREAFEADYASIAKILNRSAAHCRQIVHRAKDRVRDDRKSIDATHSAQEDDAIESLLDAIARQDVNALVALTLVTASAAPVAPVSVTAIAEQQAAQLTHALIARLRIGRIDLSSTVGRERTSPLVLA